MSVDGIWTAELYGPFGWENRGVYSLENDRIIGGDNRAYSFGACKLAGADFNADLAVYYYGPPRTVFGESDEQFTLKLAGKLEGDVIDGTVSRPDKPGYELRMRLTKRMEMPTG